MDIVTKLRKGAHNDRLDDDLMKLAADEIERLRAEVNQLRAAAALHGHVV